MNETMICQHCGQTVERRSKNQKYFRACSEQVNHALNRKRRQTHKDSGETQITKAEYSRLRRAKFAAEVRRSMAKIRVQCGEKCPPERPSLVYVQRSSRWGIVVVEWRGAISYPKNARTQYGY